MELSRKEIYKNQKISLGVTILSFIVMLLFLIFGKVATAAPVAANTNASEMLLFMGGAHQEQAQQEVAQSAADTPEQAIVESIHQFINSGEELVALKSMASQIVKNYHTRPDARAGEETFQKEYIPGEGEEKNVTGTDPLSTASNVAFDLANRNVVSWPDSKNNTQEEGTVVVEITVSPEGKVIEAYPNGRGTSTGSTQLKARAKQMALATRFNADRNSKEQTGTLTIIFSFE